MLSFFVAGKPVAKGSMRAFMAGGRARAVPTNEQQMQAWSGRISIAAQLARKSEPPISGPCKVVCAFYHARPKAHYSKKTGQLTPKAARLIWHDKTPDSDKLVRCVLDALIHNVFLDDKQAVVGGWEDLWVTGPDGENPSPGVSVEVSQTECMKLQESME